MDRPLQARRKDTAGCFALTTNLTTTLTTAARPTTPTAARRGTCSAWSHISPRPGSVETRTLSKQHGHSDNGLLRPRRCHRAVTTRSVLGELTGDSLRQFPLVRPASRVIVRQLNSAHVRLGVKWSRGSILSARLSGITTAKRAKERPGRFKASDHVAQRLPVGRADEHVPGVHRGKDQPCTTRRRPSPWSVSMPSRPEMTCTSAPGSQSATRTVVFR